LKSELNINIEMWSLNFSYLAKNLIKLFPSQKLWKGIFLQHNWLMMWNGAQRSLDIIVQKAWGEYRPQ